MPSKLRAGKMTVYLADAEASFIEECYLRHDSQTDVLQVIYTDHDGVEVAYQGSQIGQCHWRLRCLQNGGEASLHAFPGSSTYEGWWVEGGIEGMWRIVVEDEGD